MHIASRALLLLATAALSLTSVATFAQNKPRIDKAADLPRFIFRIDGKVEDVVRNAERFAPFAQALRKDIEGVLANYDIADKATQRQRRELLMLGLGQYQFCLGSSTHRSLVL